MRYIVFAAAVAICPVRAAAAPADMTPPYCAALLAGPPPQTLEQAREVLRCERLSAAASLETCASGLRQAQERLLAVPEPPSRLAWLALGAAVVAGVWAGVEVVR